MAHEFYRECLLLIRASTIISIIALPLLSVPTTQALRRTSENGSNRMRPSCAFVSLALQSRPFLTGFAVIFRFIRICRDFFQVWIAL